jgi:hypothetical protein
VFGLLLAGLTGPVAAAGPGRWLLREHGIGDRIFARTFAANGAPWTVSWHFDCSRVPIGQRHTLLKVSDGGHAQALVLSDGTQEGAIILTERESSQQINQAVRRAWHTGTSGTLTLHHTGLLFSLPIVTRCAWQVEARESSTAAPEADAVYLRTVPRSDVEALGFRFDRVRVPVPISRNRAIQLLQSRARASARARHTHPLALPPIKEALLARVHSSVTITDGCVCWVLAVRPTPPVRAQLFFVDAQTGKIRGDASLG